MAHPTPCAVAFRSITGLSCCPDPRAAPMGIDLEPPPGRPGPGQARRDAARPDAEAGQG